MFPMVIRRLSSVLAIVAIACVGYFSSYSNDSGLSLVAESKAQSCTNPYFPTCLGYCYGLAELGYSQAQILACIDNCYSHYCY